MSFEFKINPSFSSFFDFFLCVRACIQKRNDREEIRRRLAMGAEDDYLTKISATKPGRKPSLQSRLQEGLK